MWATYAQRHAYWRLIEYPQKNEPDPPNGPETLLADVRRLTASLLQAILNTSAHLAVAVSAVFSYDFSRDITMGLRKIC